MAIQQHSSMQTHLVSHPSHSQSSPNFFFCVSPMQTLALFSAFDRGRNTLLEQHSTPAGGMFGGQETRGWCSHRSYGRVLHTLFVLVISYMWLFMGIHGILEAEDTEELVGYVVSVIVWVFWALLYCYLCKVPYFWVARRARRAMRRAPRSGRSLEDGLTSADLSWRRRGWLVMLRARARSQSSSSTLPMWNLATAARRMSASFGRLRAICRSTTSCSVLLRRDVIVDVSHVGRPPDEHPTPVGPTETDAVEHLRQVVNTAVHVQEEGLFRNIVSYL